MHTITQSVFLQSLGWAILQSIWQVVVLWLVYVALGKTVFSKHIKARFILGASLLGFASLWFLGTFLHTLFVGNISSGPRINEVLGNWINSISPLISLVYLALLIAGLLRFLRGIQYVNAIRHQGISRISVEWRLYTEKTAAILNIRRKIQIWVSELVDSPVTVGFLKPVILIPISMVNNLTVSQMESIILHELAHIKRNDFLINLCLTLGETLLFYHPFARLLGKQIRKDREYICDDTVLQFRYSPEIYATALLQAERLRASKVKSIMVVAAFSEKNALLDRVNRIFGQKTKPERKNWGLSAIALIMLYASTLLPPAPKFGNISTEYASPIAAEEPGSSQLPEDSIKILSAFVEQKGSTQGEEIDTESENTVADLKSIAAKPSVPSKDSPNEGPEELQLPVFVIPDELLPDPNSTKALVSGRELMLTINGELVALKSDSLANAILLNQRAIQVNGERLVAKAIEKELIEKIDWEMVAYEQSKGVETNIAIRLELERIALEEELNKLEPNLGTIQIKPRGSKSTTGILIKTDSTNQNTIEVKVRKIVRL